MKKLLFVIGLSLGGFAIGSAQTAAATSSTATPKACCQKGGEAKACCSKDAKTTSTASATSSTTAKQCSGHDHGAQKAEVAPAAGTERKEKAKATKSN